MVHTAAGLLRILTGFPFDPLAHCGVEQNWQAVSIHRFEGAKISLRNERAKFCIAKSGTNR